MGRRLFAVFLIVMMAVPVAVVRPAHAQTGTPTRTPTSTPTPGGPNDPGNPGRITQPYETLVDGVIGVRAQTRYTLTLADHDVYDFKCSATGYNATIFWQYGSGTREGLFCNGATPATAVLRDDGRNLTIWLSMESSITENGSFSVRVRGWDDREIVTSGFTYTQSTIFNAYVEMLPLQKFDVRVQNPPATLTHITEAGTWPNGCSTIARYTTGNGLQYQGWGFCMPPRESQQFQVQSVEAGARFTNESAAYKEHIDPGNNPDPLFRLDGQGFQATPTASATPAPTPDNCRDYAIPSDGQPHRVVDD